MTWIRPSRLTCHAWVPRYLQPLNEDQLDAVELLNSLCLCRLQIPYFFGYKSEIFPLKKNPKDLDLSYKTDLDHWNCLGRVKLVLKQNFIGLI